MCAGSASYKWHHCHSSVRMRTRSSGVSWLSGGRESMPKAAIMEGIILGNKSNQCNIVLHALVVVLEAVFQLS